MGQKVLLADDSITVQKIVKLSLHEEDIEVIAFGNGAQALEEIEGIKPDLVMADVFMPGKDGYEVCEFLKAHPEMNKVPVILLVHAFEPFDPERAKAVGADLQLTKPFQSIRTLISSVKDLLARNSEVAPPVQMAAPVEAPPVMLQPVAAPASVSAEETGAAFEGETNSDPFGVVPGVVMDGPEAFALPPISPSAAMLDLNGIPSIEPQESATPAIDLLPEEYEAYCSEAEEQMELQFDSASDSADSVLDIPEAPAPTETMSFELALTAEEEARPVQSFVAFEPPGDIPVINPGFDLGTGVPETCHVEARVAPRDTDSGVQFSTVNPDEAMIEEIVNRVMQRLSTKAIQDIAWEIVPEMAEMMIRKQISKQPQLSH